MIFERKVENGCRRTRCLVFAFIHVSGLKRFCRFLRLSTYLQADVLESLHVHGSIMSWRNGATKVFIEFYWIDKGYLQMVYKSEKWKLSNTTQEDSTTLVKAGTPAVLYQWEVAVARWSKLFCKCVGDVVHTETSNKRCATSSHYAWKMSISALSLHKSCRVSLEAKISSKSNFIKLHLETSRDCRVRARFIQQNVGNVQPGSFGDCTSGCIYLQAPSHFSYKM